MKKIPRQKIFGNIKLNIDFIIATLESKPKVSVLQIIFELFSRFRVVVISNSDKKRRASNTDAYICPAIQQSEKLLLQRSDDFTRYPAYESSL